MELKITLVGSYIISLTKYYDKLNFLIFIFKFKFKQFSFPDHNAVFFFHSGFVV